MLDGDITVTAVPQVCYLLAAFVPSSPDNAQTQAQKEPLSKGTSLRALGELEEVPVLFGMSKY
jgi:hypothetical protein